jgi:hypothetical protein
MNFRVWLQDELNLSLEQEFFRKVYLDVKPAVLSTQATDADEFHSISRYYLEKRHFFFPF